MRTVIFALCRRDNNKAELNKVLKGQKREGGSVCNGVPGGFLARALTWSSVFEDEGLLWMTQKEGINRRTRKELRLGGYYINIWSVSRTQVFIIC